jgi:hypothetical protein
MSMTPVVRARDAALTTQCRAQEQQLPRPTALPLRQWSLTVAMPQLSMQAAAWVLVLESEQAPAVEPQVKMRLELVRAEAASALARAAGSEAPRAVARALARPVRSVPAAAQQQVARQQVARQPEAPQRSALAQPT